MGKGKKIRSRTGQSMSVDDDSADAVAAPTSPDDEAISRDRRKTRDAALAGIKKLASALLGGAAGLASGDPVFGLFAGAIAQGSFETGWEAINALRGRLQSRSAAEAAARLAPRAEEIRENREALTSATDGDAGGAADVAAILEMYLAAWTKAADERLRKLVENAAVNSFDPDRYEAGLNRTLFDILSRIEYGDVHVLRSLLEERDQLATVREPSLRSFHLRRLTEVRLAVSPNSDGSGTVITELGRRLLDLVDSGGGRRVGDDG